MDELQKRGPGRPPKVEIPANESPSIVPGLPEPKSKRKPFGTMQQSLAYDIPPGFRGYWFNDWPGRVDRAREAGYEHLRDKEGKIICQVVGVAEGGGPERSYLMVIPEEWYLEDMAAQQREVDRREEGIKRQIVPQNLEGGTPQDTGKFYAGKEGSSIKRQ